MSGIGILCVAIATIIISVGWALLLFRASDRRSREAEEQTFQHTARLRSVDRMRRSSLPFDGKVKQQIRVVDLSHGKHERHLRVAKPEDVA